MEHLEYKYSINSIVKDKTGTTLTVSSVTFNKYGDLWYELEVFGSPFHKILVTEHMVDHSMGAEE